MKKGGAVDAPPLSKPVAGIDLRLFQFFGPEYAFALQPGPPGRIVLAQSAQLVLDIAFHNAETIALFAGQFTGERLVNEMQRPLQAAASSSASPFSSSSGDTDSGAIVSAPRANRRSILG